MGNILYHHTKASKAGWYLEFRCQVKPAKDMRMKVEYQSRPYESTQYPLVVWGYPKFQKHVSSFSCARNNLEPWHLRFSMRLLYLAETCRFRDLEPVFVQISLCNVEKNMENKVHNQALWASKRAMSRNGRVDPVQPWICWLTARFLGA